LLMTCRDTRAGFLMEILAIPPSQEVYDYEQRRYDNLTTWLAESIDGSMRSQFEYASDGHELYSHDGGALGPVFEAAIGDAEALGRRRPELGFELRRRWHEQDEYDEMLRMVRGERPNTMVVVSDFPEELMHAPKSVGGYNVHRKQTMLRVITFRDGKITVRSQSLDGSDRPALEELYHHLNRAPRPGELLGQRMQLDMDEYGQDFLIDALTGVYDRALAARYGIEFMAGRRSLDRRNTYDFVRAQKDLIGTFIAADRRSKLGNQQYYDLAAAIQARYEGYAQSSTRWVEYDPRAHELAWGEMGNAGRSARAAGRTFDGCGFSPSFDDEPTGQAKSLGYGNKSDEKSEETKYNFDKYMYCVDCQPKPKKDEPMRWCGPCGLCKPCDFKAKLRAKRQWN